MLLGLGNRPYWRDEQASGGGYGGRMSGLTIGLPRPANVVKILLIINVAVFVLQLFLDRQKIDLASGGIYYGHMSTWLGVHVRGWWQVWRYVTFQFLHGDFWHIVLNMLGLYLLGSPLERKMGSARFLRFYLISGAVAGVAYVFISAAYGMPANRPIIGASGGVYAIVLACAVYFPNFKLIFLFFPVPIRLAAMIIFGGMILVVLSGLAGGSAKAVNQALSDVAHLGGALTAAFWIWVLPNLSGAGGEISGKIREGAWERKLQRDQAEQEQIDRILQKIKDEGINSLSGAEKRKLQSATRRQQQDRR